MPKAQSLASTPAGASDLARSTPAASWSKRSFDVLLSGSALLVLLPLLIAIAVAVRLDSAGPVLFRQRRTGLAGRRFTILKFRTMTVMEDGEDLEQARRGDARVTRLGSFLRKSSLDELPQLLNVLRGDMSIVGPRPHALAHDALYESRLPGYRLRFEARPGLTGLAQVSGLRGELRSLECMRKRLTADITYIRRWSPGLDFRIILKTLPLIVRDDHAY